MPRPPVTVAALAGTDRRATRAFLHVLADTLEPRDNVLVAGAGRPAGDPGSWRIRGPRGLARTDRRPPVHDLVVVVDERTVPLAGWLDGLVDALADPGVAAAAARTNVAEGDELLVGVPYRPYEPEQHRALTRALATGRRGDLTAVARLAGPSLAVRRNLVEAAGGVSRALAGLCPVATLAERAAGDGGRLVVAESAYLHHGGGAGPAGGGAGGAPLVSACLIVRDEHRNLPRCLGSLAGVADEVVVYDTGSVDDTVAIARAAGATVVEGYWDADFARARNEALSHCRGQWILWVDADEALACEDPGRLRASLRELSTDVEGLLVHIDNLRGTEAATTLAHPACRLFRRACGHWVGRLHEQVAARCGTPKLALAFAEGARITHWGYLQSAITGRAKGSRNVRSALADLAGGTGLDRATHLVSLGRSHLLADQHQEGVDLCRLALAAASTPPVRRLALRSVVDGLLALGRPEEALEEIARLRQLLAEPAAADVQEGNAYLALERFAEAVAAYDRVRAVRDDDGFEYSPGVVAGNRARALAGLGWHGEAADALLDSIRHYGGMDAHVGLLIECLEQSGRPLSELAEAVPPDREVAFLAQLVQIRPEPADRALEACWAAMPRSTAVLATASRMATRLPVERQLVWSARLRGQGLAGACPLAAAAGDADRSPRDRLLATAVAWRSFGDPRARLGFGAVAAGLPPELLPAVRPEVAALAPDLVPVLDALVPGAGAAGGRGDGGSGAGRRVLVVDQQVASLRTLAVAAHLRRCGHEVTVAHPVPTAGTEALLAPLGLAVHGWRGDGGGDAGGRPCAALLARLHAERPYDVVVLAPATAGAAADVRRLFPVSHLVVDADDRDPADLAGAREADLVLVAGSVVGPPRSPRPGAGGDGGPPVVPLAVSARALLAARAGAGPSPDGRAGICVVGDFRLASPAERARWERSMAPAVAGAGAGVPVAVVGDHPGDVAPALPFAVATGPLADPTPWLRSARVVLVPFAAGAAHWQEAAALCGTPALVAPPAPAGDGDPAAGAADVDHLARTAIGLTRDDAYWHRAGGTGHGAGEGGHRDDGARTAGDGHKRAGDPLDHLPPPWQRPGPVARQGGGPLSLVGSGDGTGDRGAGAIGEHGEDPGIGGASESRGVGGAGGVGPVSGVGGSHGGREGGLPVVRWAGTEGAGAGGDRTDPGATGAAAELGRRLGATGRFDLVRPGPGGDRAAVEVRHGWPPVAGPAVGARLVLALAWELGRLPAEWVGPLRDVADELWVPSSWARECAVDSGLLGDRVHVVPYGIDVDRWSPDGPRHPLQTAKPTKLLFAGPLSERSGVDVVLEAYLSAFGPDDPVCLVVRPHPGGSPCDGASLADDVRRAAGGSGAAVELVEGDLPADGEAALYRSCDALVHPYRAEGHCRAVAEAMACGLPVVVPDQGAAADLYREGTGWSVPARWVPVALPGWTPCAGGSWWLEASREALVATVRQVVADPAARRARGAAARARVTGGFTWEHAVATAGARLAALAGDAPLPATAAPAATGHPAVPWAVPA